MLPQSRARQTKASFAVLTVLWFKRDLRLDDHEAFRLLWPGAPCYPFISWNRTFGAKGISTFSMHVLLKRA